MNKWEYTSILYDPESDTCRQKDTDAELDLDTMLTELGQKGWEVATSVKYQQKQPSGYKLVNPVLWRYKIILKRACESAPVTRSPSH